MRDKNILIDSGVNIESSLEFFGDMETYDETLEVFSLEIRDKIAKISKSKENNSMPNYAILVHSLKSDAKYFGFEALAELAYEHEMQSKANNVAFVRDNYEKLMTETNRIIEVVKKYLDGSKITTNPSVDVINKKILVVDDSNIIRAVIQKIFESDYEVIHAIDGKEAIDIIEIHKDNDKLSAILLDLYMPNVDGFAVLEYLKTNDLFNKIPVSIITGNEAYDIDQRVLSYPVVSILKKPFNEVSIKGMVEKTINNIGK